ncbi:unnamed protein product [Closterium sp. NIES-53]
MNVALRLLVTTLALSPPRATVHHAHILSSSFVHHCFLLLSASRHPHPHCVNAFMHNPTCPCCQSACENPAHSVPLHPSAPICTHLHPSAPICIHLHPSAPICTHLHPSAPICTHLHPSAPICTHPHPPAHPCMWSYQELFFNHGFYFTRKQGSQLLQEALTSDRRSMAAAERLFDHVVAKHQAPEFDAVLDFMRALRRRQTPKTDHRWLLVQDLIKRRRNIRGMWMKGMQGDGREQESRLSVEQDGV